MVRVWVAAGLAVLGIVAAILAAGGLPWSLRPVSASAALPVPGAAGPVATPGAREVTDLALRQFRQGRGGDNSEAMQTLTRAVVRDLRRSAGTGALALVAQRAAEAAQPDAYVAALLAEGRQGGALRSVEQTSASVGSKLSDIITRPAPRP